MKLETYAYICILLLIYTDCIVVYVHILSIALQIKSLKNIEVKQFNYCHIIYQIDFL